LSIAQHPWVVSFYRWVVLPVWTWTTPWILPLATGAISFSCARAVMQTLLSGTSSVSGDVVPLLLGQVFVGASAALSCCVLLGHNLENLLLEQSSDPLRRPVIYYSLRTLALLIASPWRITQATALLIFDHVLMHLGNCVIGIFKCAVEVPLLAIPVILGVNILLLRAYSEAGAGWLKLLGEHTGSLAAKLVQGIARVQDSTSFSAMSDSTFAVVCIALGQIGAFATVRLILERMPVGETDSVLRNSGVSAALLDEVASTIRDPRQCARCHYGPVDFDGCSNLRSHHGERRSDGSVVSNACPRCQWFSASRDSWPRFDMQLHSRRGRTVLRQRAWGDVAMVVRAGAKALIVPFSLLRLCGMMRLPPTLSAFLALSYLLPWVVQNWKLAMSVFTESDLTETIGRLYELRQEGGMPPAVAAPVDSDDDDGAADCGARRTEMLLPGVTMSEALVNITSAAPDRIFLAEGQGCSICLTDWPEGAVEIAKGMTGEAAASALKALVPPMVALRCGHVLHLDCAAAAVEAAGRAGNGSSHVRCPLCREPATLAGAASARLFS